MKHLKQVLQQIMLLKQVLMTKFGISEFADKPTNVKEL